MFAPTLDTEQVLIFWRGSQHDSERMCAQLLVLAGYRDVDPSHPLGGPDGTKDAVCIGKGKRWVMAVYFTREPVDFRDIETKFRDDAKGIAKNGAQGMVFFTNNKLTISERDALSSTVLEAGCDVDIYHRERIRLLLDDPRGYGTRFRFLGIPMSATEQASFFEVYNQAVLVRLDEVQRSSDEKFAELRGAIDGGDTFCYLSLTWFDMKKSVAQAVMVVKKGQFAMRDMTMQVADLDALPHIIAYNIGTLSAAAQRVLPLWPLGEGDRRRYNITFFALNGNWVQMLRLVRAKDYWASATRVIRGSSVVFEEIDPEYTRLAGEPGWG